jgi:hypothetical protein
MDIVTHSVTLISIIVGIGLTEMFGNLHRLIRNRTQVTWDWLPVTWATVLLLLVINYWWAIYQGIIGIDQLGSAAELGLILIQPIILFLLTASVLPNFGTTRNWDLGRYYAETRRTFLFTFVLYQCVTSVVAIVLDTMGWNVASLIRATILLLLVLALVINKRRFDWIAASGILFAVIFRLTTQAVR